jgi:tetratricopeptide (TPR) repeat protein
VSKKWPSLGFIYLLLVIASFVLFLAWATRIEWYDRIHTSAKTQGDHIQWASYLERLAQDISGVSKQTRCYLDAAKLKEWAGQPEEAIAVLERGLYFLPEQTSIRSTLRSLYRRSGQKQKAVNLADPLFSVGEKREKIVFSLITESFGGNDPALTERLSEMSVVSLGDGRTVAIGLTVDLWTLDGNPGYLVVPGFPDKQLSQDLYLSCYAAKKDLPIIVTIKSETGTLTHIFQEHGRVKVTLPAVSAGTNGIFMVTTDKIWIPASADNRRLGVRIQPAD